MEGENDFQEAIDKSINSGINYLSEHQLPNGEFVAYMSADDAMQKWAVADSSNFMTILIGHCLLHFESRANVEQMLTKIEGFLHYQMMRGGLWQFYTKWHKAFPYLPPDADDTALASAFLKKRKVVFPDNEIMFKYNKSRSGLFYTWFTFHPKLHLHKNTWAVWLRVLKAPIKNILYRTSNEFSAGDIDIVVNANVLYYFGSVEIAMPVVNFLKSIISSNKELEKDNWYHSPLIVYYFFSRLFVLGIEELEPARNTLVNRILTSISKSKDISERSLLQSMALSALLYLGYRGTVVESLTDSLLSRQHENGYWERSILYSGPSQSIGWGSEETTTAFAIEALHLSKQVISNGTDS